MFIWLLNDFNPLHKLEKFIISWKQASSEEVAVGEVTSGAN